METHPRGSEVSGISLPVSQVEEKLFHLFQSWFGNISFGSGLFLVAFPPPGCAGTQLREEFLSGDAEGSRVLICLSLLK